MHKKNDEMFSPYFGIFLFLKTKINLFFTQIIIK